MRTGYKARPVVGVTVPARKSIAEKRSRHSRGGGNPVSRGKRHWVPAFAGTTKLLSSNSGRWVSTTTFASRGCCLRSAASHCSCSSPIIARESETLDMAIEHRDVLHRHEQLEGFGAVARGPIPLRVQVDHRRDVMQLISCAIAAVSAYPHRTQRWQTPAPEPFRAASTGLHYRESRKGRYWFRRGSRHKLPPRPKGSPARMGCGQ